MKRLLPLLLILATWAAHAAPALVQQATPSNQAPGTSATVSLTGVTAGNELFVVVGSTDSAGITFTCADSQSQTCSTATFAAASQGIYYIFYVENANAGTHTETITPSGSNTFSVTMQEFSGLATSSSFDAASTHATGFGTAITANSVTPAATGELALAVVAGDGFGNLVTSWTSPLTALTQGTTTGSPGYAVLASASAFTGQAAYSTSKDWNIGVALFKPASGGSSAPPPQPSPFAIGASLLPRGVDLASFADHFGSHQ